MDSWLFHFISAWGRGGLDRSYGASLLFLTLANTSGWIYEHRYLQHRSSWKDWEWYQSKPSPLLLSARSKMEPGGTWREMTAEDSSEMSTVSGHMTKGTIKPILRDSLTGDFANTNTIRSWGWYERFGGGIFCHSWCSPDLRPRTGIVMPSNCDRATDRMVQERLSCIPTFLWPGSGVEKQPFHGMLGIGFVPP